MTAAPAPSYSTWDELVQTWQHLDLPNKAWRAEIIEETIVMTPPPGPAHSMIADTVHRELVGSLSKGLGIFQTLGVSIPLRRSLFIPDLVVLPGSKMPPRGDPNPAAAEHALLVGGDHLEGQCGRGPQEEALNPRARGDSALRVDRRVRS